MLERRLYSLLKVHQSFLQKVHQSFVDGLIKANYSRLPKKKIPIDNARNYLIYQALIYEHYQSHDGSSIPRSLFGSNTESLARACLAQGATFCRENFTPKHRACFSPFVQSVNRKHKFKTYFSKLSNVIMKLLNQGLGTKFDWWRNVHVSSN